MAHHLGMWVQAVGIGVVIVAASFAGFAIGTALLGIGTAMVYPTPAGDNWRCPPTPCGERLPSECIVCGAILGMPSGRCLPVCVPMRLGCPLRVDRRWADLPIRHRRCGPNDRNPTGYALAPIQ